MTRGAKTVEGTVNTYTNYVNGSVIKEGASVDGFYSYQFDRLDEHGLPHFKNLTGNSSNMTNEEFLSTIFTYSGTRTPTAYGSFSTEFMYKKTFFARRVFLQVWLQSTDVETLPG